MTKAFAPRNGPHVPLTDSGPLADPSRRLTVMMEDGSVLMGLYDPDDRLVYANRAFRDAFHIAPDEAPTFEQIIRRNHRLGIGGDLQIDDIDGWMASTLSRRGKSPVRQIETRMKDGRSFQMTETAYPDGWAMVVGCDITAIGIEYRDLRQARDDALKGALTDPLTRLPNRRSLEESLDRFIGKASFHPTCVALLDIDFFKRINDTFGHATGDDVLIRFARTIQRSVRKRDCVGRIGGEEFLLLLPDRLLTDAVACVDALRAAVRDMGLRLSHTDVQITVSAGLTVIEPGDTRSAVLGRCDTALYRAKSDGRDRTRTA